MLMIAAAMAWVVQEPAGLPIPLAVSDRTVLIIDNSDTRRLPRGGQAVFRQRSEVRFARDATGLSATYRVVERRCEGPEAICVAFGRLGAGLDNRVFRFRVDPRTFDIALAEVTAVPLSDASDPMARAVATVVAQSEAAAPGAILAAELRQLTGFAGKTLPAVGEDFTIATGTYRLINRTAEHATIAVQWSPQTEAGLSVFGSGECRVSLATGLTESCRFVDWMDAGRTRPIRERETTVTSLAVAGAE